MATIKAQAIPRKQESVDDILHTFCYHYQQYTFNQARQMPFKRVKKMLMIARKEQAKTMIDMLMVVSAPHGKKGTVKSILDKFNAIINE